MSAVCVLKI
ncbi:hypothetical protein R3I94_021612 [Phoxinus phoxinus]